MCCVAKKWYVTSDMIQQQHGCCGTKEDTMYVKRIKDISYETNCCCKVCIPYCVTMEYEDLYALQL